jgi:hypothetical protein
MSKLGKGYDGVKEEEGLVRNQQRQILPESERASYCSKLEEAYLVWNQKEQLSGARRGKSCPEQRGAALVRCQKRQIFSGGRSDDASPEQERQDPAGAWHLFHVARTGILEST